MPDDLIRRVSIIVPTQNRADVLCENIASLLAQDFDSYEIIYVDDGSTDKTSKILDDARTANPDRIRVLRCAGIGPGPARNAGVEVSGGETLLFIDDDATAPPNWIAGMLAMQVRHNCDALGGGITPYDTDNPVSRYLHCRILKPLGKSPRQVRAIPTLNMLVTREAFLKVGRFKEAFLPSGEDWELCYRLNRHGFRIFFDDSISVMHRYRTSAEMAAKIMRSHGAAGIYIAEGHYNSVTLYFLYCTLRSLLSPLWLPLYYPLDLYLLALRMEFHFMYGRTFGYLQWLKGTNEFPN
jgi:glycosyltransferase involved in cell wall biosynthesis